MRYKFAVSLTLVALTIAAAMGIRSGAQSANSASIVKPTNVMAQYVAAVREAVFSGTEATNLTEVELSHLMNESIKTNLPAQLWFRHAMSGRASDWGRQMADKLRVLESLRAGHTKDAIRELEDSVDTDIMLLATQLRLSDETKTFKPTPGPRKSLQWAKEYRLKFPYKSGNPATDDQVKNALSYPDKK